MDKLRDITLHDLKIVINAMNKYNVEYVVFGGVALNIHNIPRETEDIDLFISNSKQNIENFIEAFKTLPMFSDIPNSELKLLVDEQAFEYGVIKFLGDIGLDVATKMGDFTMETLMKEMVFIEDLQINVITIKQLYNMKKSSHRDKDILDVARIRELRGADLL